MSFLTAVPNPIRTNGWLVGFYGKSTIVDYLIPNPLYTYIWFGLVRFYGISTIAGYLMPILLVHIFGLGLLDFMANQRLYVI